MSKKDIQLNIRITQELKDLIDASAKKNNRSINAEAITLMEFALETQISDKSSLSSEPQDRNVDGKTSSPKKSPSLEELLEMNAKLRTDMNARLEEINSKYTQVIAKFDSSDKSSDKK
jgi:uncharacterized protein (DUF1778 family)